MLYIHPSPCNGGKRKSVCVSLPWRVTDQSVTQACLDSKKCEPIEKSQNLECLVAKPFWCIFSDWGAHVTPFFTLFDKSGCPNRSRTSTSFHLSFWLKFNEKASMFPLSPHLTYWIWWAWWFKGAGLAFLFRWTGGEQTDKQKFRACATYKAGG